MVGYDRVNIFYGRPNVYILNKEAIVIYGMHPHTLKLLPRENFCR